MVAVQLPLLEIIIIIYLSDSSFTLTRTWLTEVARSKTKSLFKKKKKYFSHFKIFFQVLLKFNLYIYGKIAKKKWVL